MTEYWEITRERGIATVSVWGLDEKFALRELTLPLHRTQVAQLDELARARAEGQAQVLATRNRRNTVFDHLKEAIVRIPGVIEGMLPPGSDLHRQLRLVYQVSGPYSQESALRRGRFALGLWTRYNQELPEGAEPLVLRWNGNETLDLAGFEWMLMKSCVQAQHDLADAECNLNTVKTQLAALEKTVDLNNKRWFKAWVKNHLAGTREGDAARAQIPTEQRGAAPTVQEIAALYPEPDQRIRVDYLEGGGQHATIMELQWRLAGEPDFVRTAPVRLPSQFIGPFPAGTAVAVRTRAANSIDSMVLSAEHSVTVHGADGGSANMARLSNGGTEAQPGRVAALLPAAGEGR